MYNAQIIKVFSDSHSNANKYLKIYINQDKAYIYLPNIEASLAINSVMMAEFVENKRSFFYSYDSQTTKLDPEFKCYVAMKKNKELAYIIGTPDDFLSGYVRCKTKDNDNEDEEDFDKDDEETNSIFFSIVSTKNFTIVIAADSQHSKTLQIEVTRTSENQPSLESIISLLNQLNQNIDLEVSDGQEEK